MPLDDPGALASHCIHARRTTLPKRLGLPGPDPDQQRVLFEAAAAAPDHDQLLPWRFTIVEASARVRLGEAFAQALLARDPLAAAQDLARAREKALRAPLLLLVSVDIGPALGPVPAAERYLSAGCAVQNLLLQAQAMGFASGLTSGKALDSVPLRELFRLKSDEKAVCFVSIGTALQARPHRPRPAPEAFVRRLA